MRQSVRRDSHTDAGLFGTGSRQCKKCGASISDGSREWPQLSSVERWRFLIPNGALVWIGLAIVALFGGLTSTDRDESIGKVLKAVLGAGLVLLPYLPAWVVKIIQIARSRRRYALVTPGR